jgi:fermentation-respiration switch protein FrsA (DUF1100 family)
MRLMPQNQAGLRAVTLGALGFALGAFVLVSATSLHPPPHTDWDQICTGARVFFGGGDPYATVRHDHYPSYHPATAFLVATPLALLPFIFATGAALPEIRQGVS